MNQKESEYINKNTFKLCKVLEVSNDLLLSLQVQGRLLTSDIEDLKRAKQNDGNPGALMTLLTKLKGRTNSFNCLIEPCKDIENYKALEILEGYYKNTGAGNSPASNFTQPVQQSQTECNGIDPVVGSDSCSVNQVVLVLQRSASFALFRENLTAIAMGLDVPSNVIQDIRFKMVYDRITLEDSLNEVLTYWVEYISYPSREEAKLGTLIKVLQENRLKEPSQKLRSTFM